MKNSDIIFLAKETILEQSKAIKFLSNYINDSFANLINEILL